MEQYSNKRFSIFEFNDLKTKDENKYELIDGIVLMSPRPNYKHQEIMSKLNLEIITIQQLGHQFLVLSHRRVCLLQFLESFVPFQIH